MIKANEIGKSYILAAITNVWLCCLYLAVAFATWGTEKKMRRTYYRPVESPHDNARIPLPGTYKKQPDRIDVEGDPEQYFEASSPKDADELEGVHSAYTLAIIEEADDVDHDVIEAMESLVTDERDRTIAIANPPDDEINVVYDLMNDSEWETIEFSSFESQRVQVELGEIDGETIDGLATLHKIKKDWRWYNALEWPGVEAARNSYGQDGLDERWYKRRLGMIPPDTASVHRPFSPTHVEDAFDREPITVTTTPQALVLDIARDSGDYNALSALFGDDLRVLDYWRGMDHVANEDHIRDLLGDWRCPFVIDAIGEGSGLADNITTWYPNVVRFKSGGLPFEPTEYKNAWSEGMDFLGKQLKDSLAIDSTRLREELFAAARSVTFDETYIGKYDAEVFHLDPKDDIKERLERSPDLFDAAYMAVWIVTCAEDTNRSAPSTC